MAMFMEDSKKGFCNVKEVSIYAVMNQITTLGVYVKMAYRNYREKGTIYEFFEEKAVASLQTLFDVRYITFSQFLELEKQLKHVFKVYKSETDVKPQRKMPDRILDDWSNLREVVHQFRNLGYGNTYILETILNIADVKNGKNLFVEAADGKCIPSNV